MNHTRFTHIMLAALSALLLSSCAQEEPQAGAPEDDHIIFHTALPDVASRSYDNIQMGDLQGGFTVAAHNLDYEPKNVGDKIPLFFDKALVTKTPGMGDAFRGDGCRWPQNTEPGKDGKLRFYAFYPSLETLREKSGFTDDTKYFLLHDISEKQATRILYSYRIGNFKINQDILRHVDFVTASTIGNKTENLYSGVTLEFTHKLSRISFKAWSSNPSYDVEIAGVRIGGAIVSTTFNMEGNWIYGSATEKNIVEYIFRENDKVVVLDGKSYNTAGSAASIMGNGGWAMIIPGDQGNNVGKYTTWTKTASKNGVYFSVLMRVTDRNDNDDHMLLFPYIDGATISGKTTANYTNKNVVYLAVDNATGTVITRVYKNKTTKQYFVDEALKTPYAAPAGAEVRAYAWAAMPYGPVWSAGNEYQYVLDYSKGIGVEDPDDVLPGKPIITSLSVGISGTEDKWDMVKDYAETTLDDFEFEQK